MGVASPLSSFGKGRRDRRRLEVERADKWECSDNVQGRVRGLTDTLERIRGKQ